MLIAQAVHEKLTLPTHDARMAKNPVEVKMV